MLCAFTIRLGLLIDRATRDGGNISVKEMGPRFHRCAIFKNLPFHCIAKESFRKLSINSLIYSYVQLAFCVEQSVSHNLSMIPQIPRHRLKWTVRKCECVSVSKVPLFVQVPGIFEKKSPKGLHHLSDKPYLPLRDCCAGKKQHIYF